jgi:acetylornithine deacetylase
MSSTAENLAALVAFPTISRGSNRDLMRWLAARLSGLGARVRVMPGTDADRLNLLATIGPDRPDGIVLSAHVDVVPVAGQSWASEPFRLTEADGRLHGRGAVDMKGFLAGMVSAANLAATLPLRRPLHLAISHDEEIGCVGVRRCWRRSRRSGSRPRPGSHSAPPARPLPCPGCRPRPSR